MQGAHRVLVVRENDRFGDFELEPRGRQPGRLERRFYLFDEISALLEMGGREIDREAYVLRPVDRSPTGMAQNPFTDRDDEAAFFGGGGEYGRAQQSALGMLPP